MIRKKLGARVRALREAKNLSQESLAESVDMDQQYISRLESGKMNATVDSLERIAEGLGAPLFSLFSSSKQFTAPSEEEVAQVFSEIPLQWRGQAWNVICIMRDMSTGHR